LWQYSIEKCRFLYLSFFFDEPRDETEERLGASIDVSYDIVFVLEANLTQSAPFIPIAF